MYNKGDKIVYPLYGAGVIQDIELIEIDGATHTYYALHVPVNNLGLKVSAQKAADLGVRPVLPKEELLKTLHESNCVNIEMSENWNQRQQENMEKIKTGDLSKVAQVFRCLLMRERERGLSTAEKKIMTTSKQIILSELMLSLEIERSDAEEILDRSIQ